MIIGSNQIAQQVSIWLNTMVLHDPLYLPPGSHIPGPINILDSATGNIIHFNGLIHPTGSRLYFDIYGIFHNEPLPVVADDGAGVEWD